MRLRTLPLAASCVLTGSAFAWNQSMSPAGILLLGLLTTFLLQILSNLANDYGDYESGVDNEQRVGPQRAMQSGAITKIEMRKALMITAALAFCTGSFLLWFSLAPQHKFMEAIFFLVLGLLAIAAAFKYTIGKNPYGYRGLGDLFVFLFFGIVGVGGIYFLHTGTLEWHFLFPAAAVGLFSVAVLNLNNLRDHINDKISGKRTMVVMLGFQKGKIYHALIVLTAATFAILSGLYLDSGPMVILVIVPVIIQLILLSKVIRNNDPASLDGELKKVAILTFLLSLSYFSLALLNH